MTSHFHLLNNINKITNIGLLLIYVNFDKNKTFTKLKFLYSHAGKLAKNVLKRL
jgi:hypothetical protein